MTENEAKNKLDSLHYAILNCSFNQVVSESEMEALCMAKDVLEEIQQYRAIGTVEEVQKLKLLFGNENVEISELITKILKEYPEYLSIGTVEEFKQAMNFKKYFMELYGEGLEVANWHKNGDLEPLVNFIDEACN